MNRKSGAGDPSRRTPVKVSGSGFPVVPVAIASGVLVIVVLIAYLIYQSNQPIDVGGATKAAADSSSDIPGTFVPDQGRSHFPGGYPSSRPLTPFCPGVVQSDSAAAASAAAPGATGTAGASTPAPTATPSPPATATATASDATAADSASNTTPNASSTPQKGCYASNPPSSGNHLNVQKNVDLGNGVLLAQIPPNVGVYPHDVVFPRESIPHILEHAGVYVGWNCKDDNQACLDAVQKVEDLANDRIDNHDNLVRMAKDTDLPDDTIGLASWTRYEQMAVASLDLKEIERFIGTNSCRVDWEGFCK